MEVIAFLFTIFASVVAWIAWILALALFVIAKKRIESASKGDLDVNLGNALWLGLGAAVRSSVSFEY
jgi:predicted metal-binding membrane protein